MKSNFSPYVVPTLLLNIGIYQSYNLWKNPHVFNVWIYFVTVFFYFVWILRDRLIKLNFSSEGLHAELEGIILAKNEILKIETEIKNLYLDLAEFYVELVANSQRWGGWSEVRSKQAYDKIMQKMDSLHVSDKQKDKIFQQKKYWDKVDRLNAFICKISPNLTDENKAKLQAELAGVIDKNVPLFTAFLDKYCLKIEDAGIKSNLQKELSKLFDGI